MVGRRAQADRERWIARGYELLLERGIAAVTVEGLARELGVTKGSFYWHFASRDEMLGAVLDRWSQQRTDEVIAAADRAVTDHDDVSVAVRTLVERVSGSGTAEVRLYTGTGDPHPLVAAALQTVTATRLDYLSALLQRLGLSAPDAAARARAALALALGHQLLADAVPDLSPGDRDRTRDLVLELLRPAGTA